MSGKDHRKTKMKKVMNNEIAHLKESMSEMKNDLKSHNHYAQLFNENIPVFKEQIKVINHRIDDLEEAAKKRVV